MSTTFTVSLTDKQESAVKQAGSAAEAGVAYWVAVLEERKIDRTRVEIFRAKLLDLVLAQVNDKNRRCCTIWTSYDEFGGVMREAAEAAGIAAAELPDSTEVFVHSNQVRLTRYNQGEKAELVVWTHPPPARQPRTVQPIERRRLLCVSFATLWARVKEAKVAVEDLSDALIYLDVEQAYVLDGPQLSAQYPEMLRMPYSEMIEGIRAQLRAAEAGGRLVWRSPNDGNTFTTLNNLLDKNYQPPLRTQSRGLTDTDYSTSLVAELCQHLNVVALQSRRPAKKAAERVNYFLLTEPEDDVWERLLIDAFNASEIPVRDPDFLIGKFASPPEGSRKQRKTPASPASDNGGPHYDACIDDHRWARKFGPGR